MSFIVAIDGPAGSGKGTAGKRNISSGTNGWRYRPLIPPYGWEKRIGTNSGNDRLGRTCRGGFCATDTNTE